MLVPKPVIFSCGFFYTFVSNNRLNYAINPNTNKGSQIKPE
jgi:hypothetical protein